jgi:hypothetical protein
MACASSPACPASIVMKMPSPTGRSSYRLTSTAGTFGELQRFVLRSVRQPKLIVIALSNLEPPLTRLVATIVRSRVGDACVGGRRRELGGRGDARETGEPRFEQVVDQFPAALCIGEHDSGEAVPGSGPQHCGHTGAAAAVLNQFASLEPPAEPVGASRAEDCGMVDLSLSHETT